MDIESVIGVNGMSDTIRWIKWGPSKVTNTVTFTPCNPWICELCNYKPEPGSCARTRLPNGVEFTLWDLWIVPAPTNWDTYRLSDFLADLKVIENADYCLQR
ncbi:unnamed protein product [Echinostoma caproni]|uniref:ENR1 protein n=1 Tax=Echinostoma caproni TaxID=27848 RepID=A0A183BE01_9TREM|nr:unnamed protein product [Echinostoma caproni]